MNERFLRLAQVLQMVPISRSAKKLRKRLEKLKDIHTKYDITRLDYDNYEIVGINEGGKHE